MRNQEPCEGFLCLEDHYWTRASGRFLMGYHPQGHLTIHLTMEEEEEKKNTSPGFIPFLWSPAVSSNSLGEQFLHSRQRDVSWIASREKEGKREGGKEGKLLRFASGLTKCAVITCIQTIIIQFCCLFSFETRCSDPSVAAALSPVMFILLET